MTYILELSVFNSRIISSLSRDVEDHLLGIFVSNLNSAWRLCHYNQNLDLSLADLILNVRFLQF